MIDTAGRDDDRPNGQADEQEQQYAREDQGPTFRRAGAEGSGPGRGRVRSRAANRLSVVPGHVPPSIPPAFAALSPCRRRSF